MKCKRCEDTGTVFEDHIIYSETYPCPSCRKDAFEKDEKSWDGVYR